GGGGAGGGEGPAGWGGGGSPPARRAFDSPMAIACLVDLAPCLPSRTWWTSSRTNSPACVLGASPRCLSRLARASVSFSGILWIHAALVPAMWPASSEQGTVWP